MNSCNFTGRLTADPEFKTVNGKSLVNFNLAVNETKEKVHFFGFTAWEKTADLINTYCKKGNKILVETQAVQETWDSQDGKKQSKTKFRVSRVEFLESKNSANGNTQDDVPANVSTEDIF